MSNATSSPLPPRASVRIAGRGSGVLCLHSSASSSSQWRPLMDALAQRFRVLAADLHGYGKSPPWTGDRPLTLTDEVALVEPAIRAAGPRMHLVGHSYGGAVALRAALAHRERLASLVLFEPALFALLSEDDPAQPAAREIAAVRDDTTAAVARGDLALAAERFVDYWIAPGAFARAPAARQAAVARDMVKVCAEWHAALGEPGLLGALAELDLETVLLVGSESPDSSRRVAHLLERTLPRVRCVELQGVGHMAPVTHPDQVNAVIVAHLARFIEREPARPRGACG